MYLFWGFVGALMLNIDYLVLISPDMLTYRYNQNGRISSMDFHSRATNYLVTASDDESIRLYDIQNAV
jgi:WD40 repeat protein